MLEGIYCNGDMVEYDGYFWMKKKCNHKYSIKYYYTQLFCDSQLNNLGEKYLHRYVYAKYNGLIPKTNENGEKLVIHHINEDELNNTIQNLKMLTRGEHNKITRKAVKQKNPEAYKMPKFTDERKKNLSVKMKGKKVSKEQIEKAQKTKRERKLERLKLKFNII